MQKTIREQIHHGRRIGVAIGLFFLVFLSVLVVQGAIAFWELVLIGIFALIVRLLAARAAKGSADSPQ